MKVRHTSHSKNELNLYFKTLYDKMTYEINRKGRITLGCTLDDILMKQNGFNRLINWDTW
jgi:hypothetical protein